jgi:hypothetical protein
MSNLPPPFLPHNHQAHSTNTTSPFRNEPTDLPSILHPDSLPTALPWKQIPLATNIHVPSIPVLLHFNGDKSYLESWWPNMWYHSYARSLLRRYIRSPPPATQRGGRGGVWTDDGRWFSWGDMCGGWEEEVFGDGLGRWGKEGKGDGKTYDTWGKAITDSELGI